MPTAGGQRRETGGDHRRVAKKPARAIEYSRGQNKKRQLYRDLITAAEASRAELQGMAKELGAIAETAVARWRAEVDHYLPLIARVIVQTQRRVFDGETVPAGDKLVSLFEPPADIIVKRRYGASGENKAPSSLCQSAHGRLIDRRHCHPAPDPTGS
jgi:hypothetical protein